MGRAGHRLQRTMRLWRCRCQMILLGTSLTRPLLVLEHWIREFLREQAGRVESLAIHAHLSTLRR
jgi:hypothetical protein